MEIVLEDAAIADSERWCVMSVKAPWPRYVARGGLLDSVL